MSTRHDFDALSEQQELAYERQMEYNAISQASELDYQTTEDSVPNQSPPRPLLGNEGNTGFEGPFDMPWDVHYSANPPPIDPEAIVEPKTPVGLYLTPQMLAEARAMLVMMTNYIVSTDRKRDASGWDDGFDASACMAKLLGVV